MANAFFVRCDCRNRRFTGGKSRFLQEADGGKGIASAADELCGSAYNVFLASSSLPAAKVETGSAPATSRYSVSFSVSSVTHTDSRRKPLAWGPGDGTPYGNLADPPAALGSLPLRERNSCVRRRTKLPQATHRILPVCRLPNTPNITLLIPNTLFSFPHKFPFPPTIPYL